MKVLGVGLVKTASGSNIFIKSSVNSISFENNETGRERKRQIS